MGLTVIAGLSTGFHPKRLTSLTEARAAMGGQQYKGCVSRIEPQPRGLGFRV